MLNRFHLIPECNGQTDRQICYINIARQTRDKKLLLFHCSCNHELQKQFCTCMYFSFIAPNQNNFSAVAKRPRDASCLSVVSFNSTIPRAKFLSASLYFCKRGAY